MIMDSLRKPTSFFVVFASKHDFILNFSILLKRLFIESNSFSTLERVDCLSIFIEYFLSHTSGNSVMSSNIRELEASYQVMLSDALEIIAFWKSKARILTLNLQNENLSVFINLLFFLDFSSKSLSTIT